MEVLAGVLLGSAFPKLDEFLGFSELSPQIESHLDGGEIFVGCACSSNSRHDLGPRAARYGSSFLDGVNQCLICIVSSTESIASLREYGFL